MIPYGRQNITKEDISSVVDVLKSDFITQGPCIEKFEDAVSKLVGCHNSIAVNSATSALHLSCLALGLGRGDILWTSGISFVASSNCALYCGAKVDLVDIEPATINICPTALEIKLQYAKQNNSLPKILVVVHMCGTPADLKKINELSKKYDFKIIEDASHAIGANFGGSLIGACDYSAITVFSFHPVKIITTAEGGLVTTNDTKIAQKLRRLRTHGITRDKELMLKKTDEQWHYEQIELGFNYRMTDIQAALGSSQLCRLDEIVLKRNILVSRYIELLSHLPIKFQKVLPNTKSSFHLFVIQLDGNQDRKIIFNKLRDSGIGVNVHYIPIYKHPYYQKFGFDIKDFKGCERYYNSCISLPLYPELTLKEQDYIVEQLSNIII